MGNSERSSSSLWVVALALEAARGVFIIRRTEALQSVVLPHTCVRRGGGRRLFECVLPGYSNTSVVTSFAGFLLPARLFPMFVLQVTHQEAILKQRATLSYRLLSVSSRPSSPLRPSLVYEAFPTVVIDESGYPCRSSPRDLPASPNATEPKASERPLSKPRSSSLSLLRSAQDALDGLWGGLLPEPAPETLHFPLPPSPLLSPRVAHSNSGDVLLQGASEGLPASSNTNPTLAAALPATCIPTEEDAHRAEAPNMQQEENTREEQIEQQQQPQSESASRFDAESKDTGQALTRTASLPSSRLEEEGNIPLPPAMSMHHRPHQQKQHRQQKQSLFLLIVLLGRAFTLLGNFNSSQEQQLLLGAVAAVANTPTYLYPPLLASTATLTEVAQAALAEE
ncbi:hypothetical protein cyc_02901 [Cyclospora cayetanensis]|uniref:Uncharacterized protein n=1 Tax=Cyclospora cayetanensis TaxID=88456 RepID=A0A1D3CYG2_9EIME|nr:hypothetical protein cyc_02901 [Cyclospora cayetanensis]